MKKFKNTNALLWGAAIIVAALLNAPTFLTLIVLPAVAVLTLKKSSTSNRRCNGC
ncbi:MAG: hypothetical protein HRT52_13775 [Colwellia sp.]|nr:hypothetical protein [Colwellia sp.]